MTPEEAKRQRKLQDAMRRPGDFLTDSVEFTEYGRLTPVVLTFEKGLCVGCSRPDPNTDPSNRSE